MIEIVKTGALALIQDLGRPGRQELGIGHSGAADRPSLKLANRLVGNPESAAGLELTLGGLVARFTGNAVVAVTGARCPLRLDERPVDMNGPVHVRAGQVLHIGQPRVHLRSYLAVSGGIAVAEVAGSRSTDLLSGLGPPPLTRGRILPVGDSAVPVPAVDHAPQPLPTENPVLGVRLGPRDDWFKAAAIEALYSASFELSVDSNRVAIRLRGPALCRATDRELPSEPLVCGAIQVPPDGQPVLFLADHPVTGGYPVIGVVADADLPLAAQARPGQRLRFRRLPG
ncbi:MAG: biotin-dependent carboxyltransferase family protein [Stackebrandtia sp.]